MSLLYYLYFLTFDSKYIDDFYKRVVVRIVNILYPIICKWSLFSYRHKVISPTSLNEASCYLVSLTTFPERINSVWLTVESILRQNTKPDAVILWLFSGEFPDKSKLPKNLLRLENRGLQIRFCDENLKPHKKYFYSLKRFPAANIITVDDDIIYPPDLLCKLQKYHQLFPEEICATVVREISVSNNNIAPYKEWDILKKNSEPKLNNQQIGAGGVIYPPGSLHKGVLNMNTLIEKALGADDLWLKVMSIKKNRGVVSLAGEYSRFFIPLIIKNNTQLMDLNVNHGRNDRIFKELLEYYNINATIFCE